MLELGILKTWNSTTYKAGIQLTGSLTTYLDNIAVATNIAPQAMVVGNYVLVAIPGGNPRDACVVASWPAGSSGGGGGGGTKIQDADADTSWDVEQTADEDKVHGKVKGVEAFLIDDAGVLTLAKQSAFKAYRTTSQSIPASTWTKLQCNVESYDIQAEYDHITNYKFTAKTAGSYIFVVGNEFRNMAADKQMLLGLWKNGVYEAIIWKLWGVIDTFPLGIGTSILVLAVNDYIEFYAYQGDTVARDSGQTIGSCFFSGAKIA